MHIERRRAVRRAISGGIVLAGASALLLAALELIYVMLVRQPSFASAGEAWLFALLLALLLAAVGAVVGAGEGLIVLGVSLLTKLLAKTRLAEPRWMALLYSFLALPGIAALVAKAFAGRRAQTIPGKDWLALALGVAGLVAAYGAFRAVIAVRDRFRCKRWGPLQGALLAPALLLLAFAFYVADQRVLANLYCFFHVGLALLAAALCQAAVGVIYSAMRPESRWLGRLAEPGIALLLLIALVAGGAWSLSRISRLESQRYLIHEHTAAGAKILTLAGALGLTRAATASLSGLTAESEEPGRASASRRIGPKRHDASVVLVTVDALRADHAGLYGYGRPTTPNIDRWGRDAVVFDGYTQVPHTSFAIGSLLSGTYLYSVARIAPGRRHRTIAEVMRRYGFKTAAFFSPAVFYIDRQQFAAFEASRYDFEYVKLEYLDAARRVDQVLDFLEQHRDRRVFVWVHFFEPHEPYVIHEGFDFGQRAVDRYDSEIAYVDHHLGRLLAHLREKRPQTIVALTADHGEEFGEHGAHYHGNNLYDPQTRVPLIISVPGVEGRRVPAPAQVIDIPVTLLSLVDIPATAGMRGTDLGPWLAGEDPARLPPAFTELERKKAVVHGRHKLLCDTARDYCELYDLEHDPGERQNLIGSRPELALDLRRRLAGWMASHVATRAGGDPEDDETELSRLLARGRQLDPGSIPGLVRLLEGSVEQRREAARLLTLMRAASARDALTRASRDADPGVRIQATVGAALLGDEKSRGKLEELLVRRDLPRELRRDALLARVKAGERAATLDLAGHLEGSENVYEQIEIIEALGELGDSAAADALQRALKPLRTRLAAIRALGKVRGRQAVTELARCLGEDRFISWREAAAQALGLIGARAALPALQQAVRRDLEAPVVLAALAALARLEGLPVPGLRGLGAQPGSWRCGPKECLLAPRGASCGGAEARDLLLLARGAPAAAVAASGSASSPTFPAGAGAGSSQHENRAPAPLQLKVSCGEQVIGSVELSPGGGALLSLPKSATGQLKLRAAGGRPPILRYAVLRPTPTRPVD